MFEDNTHRTASASPFKFDSYEEPEKKGDFLCGALILAFFFNPRAVFLCLFALRKCSHSCNVNKGALFRLFLAL